MPKSKRQRVVTLSKTKKITKERKVNLFEQVREASDTYSHIYVFQVSNMRNNFLKEIRESLKDSCRFFFGKNKVMSKSLGTTVEEEYKEGFIGFTSLLEGDVGLLFTNSEPEIIKETFENIKETDYARAGFESLKTVIIPSGPVVRGEDEKFPHNMEPQLRVLGMPTRLNVGVVTLDRDYVICKEGDKLNSEQCQLLKHFYIPMAEFRIHLKCHWFDGKIELYDE